MLSKIFITFLILHTVRSQRPSPCPDILRYEERNSEVDRWYAVVSLTSREDLRGIWLRITLDRPAELLGNVFGEATSNDNQEFLIRSNNYLLQGGTTTPVRFFVKYNAASVIPSVVEVNLNGRSICSSSNQPTNIATTESNNLAQSRPTSVTSSGSRRPITSTNVANTRPRPSGTTTTSNQATLSSSNNRPNRPSNGNVNTNNNRPTRPSTSQSSNFNNRLTSTSNNFNTATENYRPVGPSINTDNEYSIGSNQNSNFNRPTGTGFNFENDRDTDDTDTEYNNAGGVSSGLSVNSEVDDSFFAGDFSEVVNRPTSNPSRPSINRQQQCGTVVTQPSPLISFGQNTIPGQWPWHAALYHSKGIQLMYTCGGTLISTRHILTAAHCVTKPHTNRAINPQNILVYLGKYNLKKFGSEIQDKEVADIFVHHQYNYTGYYNDIAILRLAEPAQLTNFVRPVCLWDEPDELNEIVGRLGTVVGWGFDQNRKLSTNLMKAQMPIVSTSTCIYSNRDFFSQFTSEKSFCAGFRNGTSVCNGDSGGGMVFPRRGTSGSRTVWQIRGLVSVGVALQGQGVCDASQYIVFTDVAKFSDWIQQILTNHL